MKIFVVTKWFEFGGGVPVVACYDAVAAQTEVED